MQGLKKRRETGPQPRVTYAASLNNPFSLLDSRILSRRCKVFKSSVTIVAFHSTHVVHATLTNFDVKGTHKASASISPYSKFFPIANLLRSDASGASGTSTDVHRVGLPSICDLTTTGGTNLECLIVKCTRISA